MTIIRLLICFCLGTIASLSLPPFGFLFFLPISFTALLHVLLTSKSKRLSFYYGWFFGFGYFLFSLSWIGNALMVEADKFAWMKPIALIGIPAFLGIYIGLVAFISSMVPNSKILSCWIFAITWTLAEVIRSYFIFPFPWNILGYSFYSSNELSQFASILGVYGLSFIAVLFSSIFITRSLKAILISILFMGTIYLFGSTRLSKQHVDNTDVLSVRIVHSGQLAHHLGDQDKLIKQIKDLIKLSSQAYKSRPDVIIWPEAIVPLEHGGNITKVLSDNLPKGSCLITGSDRISYTIDKYKYYNSIISIDPNGEIGSIYDKHILVPFGEYIPMRWLFPSIIQKVAYGIGDFSSGEGNNLINIDQIKALPLICYEAIFSFYLKKFQLSDVDFIINITNDSWFGDSIGPKQHFYMSKFRAIEYGMPLIRVANGGISGFIDKYGIDLIKIDDKQGVVQDVYVPKMISEATFYQKYLHVIQAIFLIVSIISYIFFVLAFNKNQKKY